MHAIMRRLALGVILASLGLSVWIVPVLAGGTDILVSDAGDVVADDGACTLREAIIAANTNAASGAMAGECPAGSASEPDAVGFLIGPATIELATDLPAITEDLRIASNTNVTVDGNDIARPITVTGGSVEIWDLAITNGFGSEGGAVRNSANLVMAGVQIYDSASPSGGAIFNEGDLSLSVVVLDGNDGGSFGGAILNSGGTVSMLLSIISGNTATNAGGIYNTPDREGAGGVVTIDRSTISGNSGTFSAGIESSGVLIISNSTVAGNEAEQLIGGIANTAGEDQQTHLTLLNVTISGNSAGEEGGGLSAGGGSVVKNTIIAGNSAPSAPDVSGAIGSEVANLIGVPAGLALGDILDPAGLQDNGGFGPTIALVPGAANPAVDQADGAVCAAGPVAGVDQRGEARPAGACDIGAYEAPEVIPTQPPGPTVIPTQADTARATPASPAGSPDWQSLATLALALCFVVGASIVTERSRRRA